MELIRWLQSRINVFRVKSIQAFVGMIFNAANSLALERAVNLEFIKLLEETLQVNRDYLFVQFIRNAQDRLNRLASFEKVLDAPLNEDIISVWINPQTDEMRVTLNDLVCVSLDTGRLRVTSNDWGRSVEIGASAFGNGLVLNVSALDSGRELNFDIDASSNLVSLFSVGHDLEPIWRSGLSEDHTTTKESVAGLT